MESAYIIVKFFLMDISKLLKSPISIFLFWNKRQTFHQLNRLIARDCYFLHKNVQARLYVGTLRILYNKCYGIFIIIDNII